MWYSISGNKTAGNSQTKFIDWGGAGPVLTYAAGGTKPSSNMITADDTDYQTDVALKSVHNMASATSFPGNGDVILVIDWTAGSIDIHLNISYHTHDATHP
jgi:hypothetical protein